MIKYKHIVCPVDLSEHSDKLIQQAIDFRNLSEAKLTVVHFIEPLPMTAYNIGTIDMQENIAEKAKKEITALAKKYGLQEEDVHVITEHPKRAIDAFAREINADLIVMGHGKHNFVGHLLGSTASAVANHAPCDVFIVKN